MTPPPLSPLPVESSAPLADAIKAFPYGAITIEEAAVHNLKQVSLTLPRHQLVVFTGVSGSGKSTLAFDTLFAEGQRRFLSSLSSYAQQFLHTLEKPAVGSISGLSPAIAIDQKTTSRSPRSTVGTVTEIVDILRVLYARIGQVHCPECLTPVMTETPQRITQRVLRWKEGSRIQLMAPVVRGRKGDYNALFQQLRKEGFSRVRIDGALHLLDELPDDYRLAKTKVHNIEVVVDRLVIRAEDPQLEERLERAITLAIKRSDGFVIAENLGTLADQQQAEATGKAFKPQELFFAKHLACPHGHDLGAETTGLSEMAPRLFSFNSPYGACTACDGLGERFALAPEKCIPDPGKSLGQGAIAPLQRLAGRYAKTFVSHLAKAYGISTTTPWEDLPAKQHRLLMDGPMPAERDAAADKLKLATKPKAPKASPGSPRGKTDEEDTGLLDDVDWMGAIEQFMGLKALMQAHYHSGGPGIQEYLGQFMQPAPCNECQGARLKPLARLVTLGGAYCAPDADPPEDEAMVGKTLHALGEWPIAQLNRWIRQLPERLSPEHTIIASQALSDIAHRLSFLEQVGLPYLTLNRPSATLSGGEAQRIRLAAQLGAELSGVLYILDEPSIGLHPHNNQQLIETLQRLRDKGNSVIVVEHDEDTIRAADWVVDIGPESGTQGGQVVAQGPPDTLIQLPESYPQSLTVPYLTHTQTIPRPASRRPLPTKPEGWVHLLGLTRHNLQNIAVKFPPGTLTVVTGLSGAGKSTVVMDVLWPLVRLHLGDAIARPEGVASSDGLHHWDKVIVMDQSPIGRSPRSNPATYTGLMTVLREIFAQSEEAKVRGYSTEHFSFNTRAGQCPACKGLGVTITHMSFLPDVTTTCEQCEGQRFHPDVMTVRLKLAPTVPEALAQRFPQGLSIADALQSSVSDALALLGHYPRLAAPLQLLEEVGLGYVHLGQASNTLSGGEAQRVKLAAELLRPQTGHTLYIMDEPTVGLHWHDLAKLLPLLQRLVDHGNTVLVIEHHLDLIKCADYVIDLGPGGGTEGGHVMACGNPEQLAANPASLTGQALIPYLSLP